jgi:hypothetical protein
MAGDTGDTATMPMICATISGAGVSEVHGSTSGLISMSPLCSPLPGRLDAAPAGSLLACLDVSCVAPYNGPTSVRR